MDPLLLLPIVGILMGLYGGYLLRGLTDKRRRKLSMMDDRLHDVREAVARLERQETEITILRLESAGLDSLEQRTRTPQRISEDYIEAISILAAGLQAAVALGSAEMPKLMGEVSALLATYSSQTGTGLNVELTQKLAELRTAYEALREKLAE